MMLFFFNGFIGTKSLLLHGQRREHWADGVIKRYFIDEEKIRSKIEENRSKAKDRTKPSFARRLQKPPKNKNANRKNWRNKKSKRAQREKSDDSQALNVLHEQHRNTDDARRPVKVQRRQNL